MRFKTYATSLHNTDCMEEGLTIPNEYQCSQELSKQVSKDFRCCLPEIKNVIFENQQLH